MYVRFWWDPRISEKLRRKGEKLLNSGKQEGLRKDYEPSSDWRTLRQYSAAGGSAGAENTGSKTDQRVGFYQEDVLENSGAEDSRILERNT